MPVNWTAVLVAALIPVALHLLWYHPRVLGGAWQRVANIPAEAPLGAGKLALFYGLSLLFALFITVSIAPMVIHQWGTYSLASSDPGWRKEGSDITLYLKAFAEKWGDKHRSFGHGALHGAIAGFFLALPLIASTALFERRGFKYIAIHGGYWILSLTLMGGLICGWR